MGTTKIKAKAKVWTHGKNVVLKGTLESLIVDDAQSKYTNVGDGILDLPVQLFHAGRVWWLYYGYDHQTGGFKSKKDAVRWWVHGGR